MWLFSALLLSLYAVSATSFIVLPALPALMTAGRKGAKQGGGGALIGPDAASKASKSSKRGCLLADSLSEPEQPSIA